MNTLISLENSSLDARPCCFPVFSSLNYQPITSIPYPSIFRDSTHLLFLMNTSSCFSSFLFLSVLLSSPQGTLNNQTGIFPKSFVKIIKPLPDSDVEGEGEGPTYSCLRCFLLTPSGVDTRCVCVCMFL